MPEVENPLMGRAREFPGCRLGDLESSTAEWNVLIVVPVGVIGPGGIRWAKEAPYHTSYLILIVQASAHCAQCSLPSGSWMEIILYVLKS